MVGFQNCEDLEKRGLDAFVDEDYDAAVNFYTEALSLEADNASVYINRAAAHIKLKNFTDAVADATRAIELNPKLSKAYLRKGIACFHLEEYQTAKTSFEAGAALDPKTSTFKTWISKCDAKIREENGEAVATSKAPSAAAGNASDEAVVQLGSSGSEALKEEPSSSSLPESVPTPSPPAPPKYRHTWYQSQSHAFIEIFAKGVKKADLDVDFGEQILNVVINSANSDEPYVLQLRLFGKIVPAQCSYSILSTKVEIKLAKADGTQWKQLEFDSKPQIVKTVVIPKEEKLKYPTSNKKPAKDWDKMEAEVKKEEKDEKLEGDAALNKLFREIYSNADEDTRRAMNKSFVESNGTVLSTNWKDVGKKKIEGSPPSGMDMKKWEI